MIWCNHSLSIIITQCVSSDLVTLTGTCLFPAVLQISHAWPSRDTPPWSLCWEGLLGCKSIPVWNENNVNICVVSFHLDPITVCKVMRLSLPFSLFNVDPPQYGFCQAPENHWRRLQSKVPELHRWQRLHGLQWGLDPHESESAYQVASWLYDHAGWIKAVETQCIHCSVCSAFYTNFEHHHFTYLILFDGS